VSRYTLVELRKITWVFDGKEASNEEMMAG
jgi:hypothetical protein